jgi:hypothetical protein
LGSFFRAAHTAKTWFPILEIRLWHPLFFLLCVNNTHSWLQISMPLWAGIPWCFNHFIDKKRTNSSKFNTNFAVQAVCPFEFGRFKLYVVDLFKLTLIVIACGTALFTQFRSALMNVTLHCGW